MNQLRVPLTCEQFVFILVYWKSVMGDHVNKVKEIGASVDVEWAPNFFG